MKVFYLCIVLCATTCLSEAFFPLNFCPKIISKKKLSKKYLQRNPIEPTSWNPHPITYALTNDPIDVVIPAIEKDLYTLDLCIKSIKTNGQNIRNVYVVSPRKLTENAIWVDEKIFPFTMVEVGQNLFETKEALQKYLEGGTQRVGWYFQQLLKLYAHYTIPNISSNVLVLDADTLFINPVSFMNEKNEPFFSTFEVPSDYFDRHPYFIQARSLLPGFKEVFQKCSAVNHHMLLQKEVLNNFLWQIEKIHNKPAWQALCNCVKKEGGKPTYLGLSEFELYFNFMASTSNQVHIRILKSENQDPTYDKLEEYKEKGYHSISCHSFLRDQKEYDKGPEPI